MKNYWKHYLRSHFFMWLMKKKSIYTIIVWEYTFQTDYGILKGKVNINLN